MKKMFVKIGAALLACSLLLTGCGNVSETVTTTDAVTTSAVTTATTEATVATTVTTEATKTTQTTATTQATTTAKPLPEVKPFDGTLTEEEIKDKILGGWIGQMAGVVLFAKTEFGWAGRIMTEERLNTAMAEWNNGTVSINNAFAQDDLYVEIPFMDAMKENGALCDVKYMAEKFRDSAFPLWHANLAGRDNLRQGLEWPDSGHYLFNGHADDIDWQIECDFLGQMYPGLVNASALRSFDIGHIMNYGDGVYGGVFVTAMHAAAYTANSVDEIIEAGLAVIPDGTTFKEAMNVVMDSYKAGDTWQQCWQKLETKYGTVDKCPEMSTKAYNIDAKLNAAYILVGLLWGEGDFEQSMIISGRCGQDSDCNPSSVASILGNFYGAANIPEKWKKGLNYNTAKFSETNYTLNDVIALNYELMSEVLLANGATLKDGVWTVTKDTEYKAVPFEQWTDEFDAGLIVTSEGNGVVKLNLVTNGNEKIKSIKLDMGDGFVANGNLAKYAYAKTGEYTIKYTVVSESGKTVSKERKVIVEDSLAATPICSVTAPTGGGNKDMNVMFDGYTPYVSDSNSALQYDTYDGGKAKDSVYAGLEFSGTYTVSALEFTEGKHFNDGGWFAEVPTVEVLVNGVWKAVEATSSYPSNNTKAGHGNNFDKYVFTLKQSVACQGIRLNGKPGGSAYFISVGEFNPVVVAGAASATFDNNDIPLIISNVTAPKGSCNHDILIIADGKTGTGNADQYNTYVGVTPGVQTYFGYLYKTNKMIKTIEFTEGNHWNNDGGWFENGIRVEVLVNGEWKEVEATCEYPIGDSFEAHGNAYETFVISLKTLTTCRGVRIVGEAGGPNGFVSISELTVK
ncbi:MAG: hypothetical protein E7608_00770 [Ruminococcaceae bacterium]|nr:hypothetical protein [Oscillospiraceae bacterium]